MGRIFKDGNGKLLFGSKMMPKTIIFWGWLSYFVLKEIFFMNHYIHSL